MSCEVWVELTRYLVHAASSTGEEHPDAVVEVRDVGQEQGEENYSCPTLRFWIAVGWVCVGGFE